jgi:superoxide reductase
MILKGGFRMADERFFICKKCGNMVGVLYNSGAPMSCCGQEMEALRPNSIDASQEKHVPVVKVAESIVSVAVGSVEHPMTKEHHIEWIYLQTAHGGQRRILTPDDKPAATFALTDGDKAVAVYAYCNLHGLWVTKL